MPVNVRGVGKPIDVAVVTFEGSERKPEFFPEQG
jgi:hypothetical protein